MQNEKHSKSFLFKCINVKEVIESFFFEIFQQLKSGKVNEIGINVNVYVLMKSIRELHHNECFVVQNEL